MSGFKLDYFHKSLPLHYPFTISRGTKKAAENVFLKISKDDITGWGEAAPNPRYSETPEIVLKYFREISKRLSILNEVTDLEDFKELSGDLYQGLSPVYSAMAAMEMAWLDWYGKKKKLPLRKLLGLQPDHTIKTSYTIGIDTAELMKQKVKNAPDYEVYKIKLGTDRDREIIHSLRQVTDKPLRVDANEGWTSVKQAKEEISFLKDMNVELIEQPMPSASLSEMEELKKWSPLPLIADESFTGIENIEAIERGFHGVNIKLMKTGKILESLDTIQRLREKGMKLMIGCMLESSLAISAGTLLALEADYADLDGHLLISQDPFSGLKLKEGKIVLNNKPGLGVHESF